MDILFLKIDYCNFILQRASNKFFIITRKNMKKGIAFFLFIWYNIIVVKSALYMMASIAPIGGIAQLVRAHAWHAWGHWFNSNCLHHIKNSPWKLAILLIFRGCFNLILLWIDYKSWDCKGLKFIVYIHTNAFAICTLRMTWIAKGYWYWMFITPALRLQICGPIFND